MDILGSGAYGEVYKTGDTAIKKYDRLAPLVQEYLALIYIQESAEDYGTPKAAERIVRSKGFDLNAREMSMHAHQSNFREWMTTSFDPKQVVQILVDILVGLAFLHSRGLAHGDIKPSNILIDKESFLDSAETIAYRYRATIGDCGFVTVSKHLKINCTAKTYRDPSGIKDSFHDIYSLAICVIEVVHGITSYYVRNIDNIKKANPFVKVETLECIIPHEMLTKTIVDKVPLTGTFHRDLLLNMVNVDRSKRPSARQLLEYVLQVERGSERPVCDIDISTIYTWKHYLRQMTRIGESEGMSLPCKTYLKRVITQCSIAYGVDRAKLGLIALTIHLRDIVDSKREGTVLTKRQIERPLQQESLSVFRDYALVVCYVLHCVFGSKLTSTRAYQLLLRQNKTILREIMSSKAFRDTIYY